LKIVSFYKALSFTNDALKQGPVKWTKPTYLSLPLQENTPLNIPNTTNIAQTRAVKSNSFKNKNFHQPCDNKSEKRGRQVPPKCPWQEETFQATSAPARHQSENQRAQLSNQDFLLPNSATYKKSDFHSQIMLHLRIRRKISKATVPAWRRLLTTVERPSLVRLEGMAIDEGGTLRGGLSFVTNRTWTRLEFSSASPSISISIKSGFCVTPQFR
jgi:hypothetical protein